MVSDDDYPELLFRLVLQEYAESQVSKFDKEAGLEKLRRWMQENGYLSSAESFTCPDCGMTSYNPNDVMHRYCGNCHEFKGE